LAISSYIHILSPFLTVRLHEEKKRDGKGEKKKKGTRRKEASRGFPLIFHSLASRIPEGRWKEGEKKESLIRKREGEKKEEERRRGAPELERLLFYYSILLLSRRGGGRGRGKKSLEKGKGKRSGLISCSQPLIHFGSTGRERKRRKSRRGKKRRKIERDYDEIIRISSPPH